MPEPRRNAITTDGPRSGAPRNLQPPLHYATPHGSQKSGSNASAPVPLGATHSPQPSRTSSPISFSNPGELIRNLMPPADNLPACPGATFPLNPDLPTSDVLFIFSNFASYAKAPGQGQYGVGEGGLRNATRLLEYAKECQASPRSNVHILHLKYRADDGQGEGPPRKTTPPFPTQLDPVIKIEAHTTGMFEPPPGAAVFDHIAKHISPTPRYIVYSYVGSWLTNQQLGMLSSWCAEADPPITLLSPFETRIREDLPLELALRDGVDISMYADEEDDDDLGDLKAEGADILPWEASGSMGRWSCSQSGGGYMRGRREAMKGLGVKAISGGSFRPSSYVSDLDGSIPMQDRLRRQKSVRTARLEDVVDGLDLGDGLGQDVDGMQTRRSSLPLSRSMSIDNSDSIRSMHRVLSQTPPRLAHPPYPHHQRHSAVGREGATRRSQTRQPSNVAFRDLVITHMDKTDPEFIQTYID